ncbi:MAG TPA: hypothetical protein VKB50_28410 [Vicinamibacterales bacterium]|nr:hypothetical protein [Vicinamibacterales bacterium]
MTYQRRAVSALFVVLALVIASGGSSGAQRGGGDERKPSLSLKANPPVGFSPLRVRLVVDVKNGSNDYEEYYCPKVQWDWGDGTVSENSEDCDPYQAGKSEIKRRYSVEHVFKQAGTYQVFFRLKQRERVTAAISANVEVRPGVRDDLGQ